MVEHLYNVIFGSSIKVISTTIVLYWKLLEPICHFGGFTQSDAAWHQASDVAAEPSPSLSQSPADQPPESCQFLSASICSYLTWMPLSFKTELIWGKYDQLCIYNLYIHIYASNYYILPHSSACFFQCVTKAWKQKHACWRECLKIPDDQRIYPQFCPRNAEEEIGVEAWMESLWFYCGIFEISFNMF